MSISLENFSPDAEAWLRLSVERATRLGHELVKPSHLLQSLLEDANNEVLISLRTELEEAEALPQQVAGLLQHEPQQPELQQAYISQELKALLLAAEHTALRNAGFPVAPEHLLLALRHATPLGAWFPELPEPELPPDPPEEVALDDPPAEAASADPLPQTAPEVAAPTPLAPLEHQPIGRDSELRELIQVLCRRTHSNALLVGEPGVGKTMVVHGLAARMAAGSVPERLQGVTLQRFPAPKLLVGARGYLEHEARLKSFLQQLPSEPPFLLVIEDLHQLPAETVRFLFQLLQEHQAPFIATCVRSWFREHLEADTTLMRHVQAILLEEPDEATALAILRGAKHRYEEHHQVRIRDSALSAAVRWSTRFLPTRFLPDKALDLLDEAATSVRMQFDSVPDGVEVLERQLRQLELEQESLRYEPTSSQRLLEVQRELPQVQQKLQDLKERWQEERMLLQQLDELQGRIDAARMEEQEAQGAGDLERAAQLHFGTIVQLEQEQQSALQRFKERPGRLLKEEVDEEEIARVISHRCGVDLNQLLDQGKDTLLQLEAQLGRRVFGQEGALERLASTLRRNRAGLHASARPAGAFLLAGGSGVGKHTTAKALSQLLFRSMPLRFDLSEYSDASAGQRLFGSSPNSLASLVRRQRYGVLLLEDAHRAHPEVLHRLGQILSDGRLGELNGVDFQDMIFFFTLHLPVPWGEEEAPEAEECAAQLNAQAHAHFPSELRERLDEVLIYQPLEGNQMRQVVEAHLLQIRQQLQARRVDFGYGEAVLMNLAQRGQDPRAGAHPLERLIQREIQEVVATKLLSGEIREGSRVHVDAVGNVFRFDIH